MKEGISGGTRLGCEKLSNCFEGSSSSFINKACHQERFMCVHALVGLGKVVSIFQPLDQTD
ncbi:hypothetical protein NC651_039613 [Populus alba x Populus x berolinensis]|nr:hypothetical protein NC651_039613 [Populus alba x Populus x berolinensis]